jgi:hypothetical protein
MPRIRLVGVSRGQGLNVTNMFLAIDCNFNNGAGKPIFGSSTSLLGRNRLHQTNNTAICCQILHKHQNPKKEQEQEQEGFAQRGCKKTKKKKGCK